MIDWIAHQVISFHPIHQRLQCPLNTPDDWLRTAHVLHQHQLSVRAKHATGLAECFTRVGNAAKAESADRCIETFISKRQCLSVTLSKIRREAQRVSPLTCNFKHRTAELYACQADPLRIE